MRTQLPDNLADEARPAASFCKAQGSFRWEVTLIRRGESIQGLQKANERCQLYKVCKALSLPVMVSEDGIRVRP